MDLPITTTTIIIYFLLIGGIGLYVSRFVHNRDGFFVAGRKLSWPLVGLSLGATVLGGSATIAAGSLIYVMGLPGLWFDIGGIIGLLVLGIFIAGIVRKTNKYTLPSIIADIFDGRVHTVASILILLTQVAWVALLLQACTAVVGVIVPTWDITLILALLTLLFVAYTLIGGQISVVYTDVIQMIIMLVAICLFAAPYAFSLAQPFSQLNPDLLSFPTNSSVSIFQALSMFLLMFMPNIVGPDVYSKILSARDQRHARLGAITASGLKLIYAIGIGIIALSAVILFPGLSNPATAIPLTATLLPPVVAGIVLAGLISAMLSSADSVLLSGGTILSVDLFKNNSITTARIGMAAIALFGFILAVALGDIITTLKLAYTVFTAGLTLPVLFGLYKEKTHVTSRGALFSLLLGGSVSLLWFSFEPFAIDAVLVGMLCSLLPLLVFRDHEPKSTHA